MKPGSVTRKVFRAPVWLYDHHLGWLLGRRFLCITHTGRKSGRTYRTVLEVVAVRGAGEFLVIAGLGRTSDWYRNIRATPASKVVVGRHQFRPVHRVLDETEAAAVMADYQHRNRWIMPIIRPVLTRLLGWHYDGSTAALAHLARQLPILALSPKQSPHNQPNSHPWPRTPKLARHPLQGHATACTTNHLKPRPPAPDLNTTQGV
jgi:deazaflavin-dependent oxidoreductase (nitroreductase family)